MNTASDDDVRRIYERWHDAITKQDLAGIVSLYAEHAVFESPTVLALAPDRSDGILRGRSEIERQFATNFGALAREFRELYRTGLFFSNGRHLTWEYPRLAPGAEQVDLFESMDIEDGLIVYHRVYWGWKGLRTLIAARDRAA
ncbi:MAG: nuclear transport factor 2 family protein [Reyranellaceae bacterium]